MGEKEKLNCTIDYRETVHTLNLVTKIAELIVATNSIEEITKIIYEIMKSNFGECTAGIGINSLKKKKLIRCFYYEFGKILEFGNVSHNNKNSYLSRCVMENQEIKEEYIKPEDTITIEGVQPKALIFIPLRLEDKVIGVFTYQLHNREYFLEKELILCKRLINFITISLHNNMQNKKLIKLNNELQKYSEKDDLTGLYNRKNFYKQFNIECRKIIKKKKKMYLYLVDLDNFKGVNDVFGHSKGDEAIKNVGELLREKFFGKLSGRYGGDEFLGGISIKSKNEAQNLAKEIVKEINNLNIYYDNKNNKVGASVGVYEISKLKDFKKMIEDVDRNLYKAKRIKNNIVIS